MSLPPNVHVSKHPCLLAKLSRLRSEETEAREVKSLVHEISLIVGCEAFASALNVVDGPKGKTPIGYEYTTTLAEPHEISVVPILRSGLGMVDAIQTLLPTPVPVHHLGLYREPSTLQPVEYYNNLPNHTATSQPDAHASSLAIVLDPVIATGGTCVAAIQTLKEWGVKKIVVLSVIAASEGVRRAAAEWSEAVEIWVAGVDNELTTNGMLKPGLGDIGDRIFLTIGK
ncbi:uracil phosphoribosyltransferase-domain-containing protein [Hypoxylon argillaceum]|nr:uracil phosphoribosyltransferase-domain-containing protein [Hypoxylon argillaceum]KAI1150590.1 uracil phosphoribosyltransferase-domain-containing protein [Nemania diffusa]